MNLEIRKVEDKDIWDSFVKASPNCNFMQSWEWGEYQSKGLGRNICRLGFWDKDVLMAVADCHEQIQTFGKYAYITRGPILRELNKDLYRNVLELIKRYFKDSNYVFVKIDPAIEAENLVSQIPFDIGFKKSINYVQPEEPWILDLVGNTEEEQFVWCKQHGMNKNYPTYIRKARKEGVIVRFSKDPEEWKQFTEYLKRSSENKNFVIRKPEYYLKQLEYMGQSGQVRLAIAEYQGEPLVMLILAFYGDEVSCLYSAQTGLYTKLRGPMLLRWECMLQAQQEGFKKFNSWGALSEKRYKPGNPQYGYANFKRGFGGYLVKYQKTLDYPIKRYRYFLVRLLDVYRKIRFYRDR